MTNLLVSSKAVLNEFINQDKYLSKKDIQLFWNTNFKIMTNDNEPISFNDIEKEVEYHNTNFVQRKLLIYKTYFDNMFSGIDKNILLDEEQRIAVLTDEDYSMVIAGAGSGKTTTMAAKVKYLIEKQNINPDEIILISYTNKAVLELDNLINKKFKLNVKISTFHSLGYEILNINQLEKPKVETNGYYIIADYFANELAINNEVLKEFMQFFLFYFDVPMSALKFKSLNDYHHYKKRNDYESLKSRLNDYNKEIIQNRSNHKYSIQNEFLKSVEEVMIANFLYLNNIEYDYEKPYQPISQEKIYLPDFTIYYGEKKYYLEHFGINRKGFNTLYKTKDMNRYKKTMDIKRKIHNKHNTTLIMTQSDYEDGRSLLEHLKEELENVGIILKPKSDYEIYSALVDSNKDTYYQRFIVFCLDFIKGFKTKGYDKDSFKILKENINDERIKLFLDFTEKVYLYYQRELKIRNSIDFEDMINDSYRLLNQIKKEDINLKYKYIIIDEYQDISIQRFNLTKKISDLSDAKVVAVGDDWQAVFAFAGSDVSLFTKFKELMGYGKELQITNTYRNSQELIDIAGKFITENNWQIKKKLKAQKRLPFPVNIITYDDEKKRSYNKALAVEKCLVELYKEYGEKQKILLIGRYGFDKYHLTNNDFFFEYKQDKIKASNLPELDITYLTAHSSKGLGFDNVIIINANDETYGFPSQLKDDPILDIVKTKTEHFLDAEERRLFYVALTRTKNKVYVVTSDSRPSRFLLELKKYPNVRYLENNKNNLELKCPICSFPLLKRKNNFGIPNLYVCSNEKEICDFMTNDLKYKRRIKVCPLCKEGYEIIRYNKTDKNYFIGCSKFHESNCQYTKQL